MKIKKLTTAAFFAALCCVATMVIRIPAPIAGYIHFGDMFVLLSGWLLGGWGIAAAGVGSMLADIFAGYADYALVTLIDKAATAAIALLVFVFFKKLLPNKLVWMGLILSAIAGELVMAFGYTAYECLRYGWSASIINLPANLVQGTAGAVFACLLYPVLSAIMVRVGVKQRAK